MFFGNESLNNCELTTAGRDAVPRSIRVAGESSDLKTIREEMTSGASQCQSAEVVVESGCCVCDQWRWKTTNWMTGNTAWMCTWKYNTDRSRK